MKKILSITIVAVLLTMVSCKKELNKPMTVVKDCTGTYLRMDGKDFKVCDHGELSRLSEGTQVTATFRKIENCTDFTDTFLCKMLHKNEGWIDVIKIKQLK